MIYVYKNINFLWTHKYCILTIKNPAVLFYCNNHVHGERGRRETVQGKGNLNSIIFQLTLDHCDILFFTRQLWNIFNEICIDIKNSNEKCGGKNPKTWMLYSIHVCMFWVIGFPKPFYQYKWLVCMYFLKMQRFPEPYYILLL